MGDNKMVFSTLNGWGRVRPLAVVVGMSLLGSGCSEEANKLADVAHFVQTYGVGMADEVSITYELCENRIYVEFSDFKEAENPFFEDTRAQGIYDSRDSVKICRVSDCEEPELDDCGRYIGRHRGLYLDEAYETFF